MQILKSIIWKKQVIWHYLYKKDLVMSKMKSKDALEVIQRFSVGNIYVVPNETMRDVLVEALVQVFEFNYSAYTPRIRIGGEPTPVG